MGGRTGRATPFRQARDDRSGSDDGPVRDFAVVLQDGERSLYRRRRKVGTIRIDPA